VHHMCAYDAFSGLPVCRELNYCTPREHSMFPTGAVHGDHPSMGDHLAGVQQLLVNLGRLSNRVI